LDRAITGDGLVADVEANAKNPAVAGFSLVRPRRFELLTF